jgi:nucleotide-binding universal stress UspA family protein
MGDSTAAAGAGPAADPATVETVLVPVDGSEPSDRAVEHAVAVASRYEADLHALVVLGERAATALNTGAMTEEEVAAEGAALADAVHSAAPPDVPVTDSAALGFSPTVKTRHPGSVVLDCADEVDADFVVVPREPIDESGDTLAKAAEYVVSYASQPVLSV